ncbi:MAG: FAD-dependent oxidoreductase, partial [Deltaproteobacteria bacterium]
MGGPEPALPGGGRVCIRPAGKKGYTWIGVSPILCRALRQGHFAKGGTGALVAALVKKLEELGGRIRYGAEVRSVEVVDERGRRATKHTGRRIARGVTLMDGERLEAALVVSNADYVHTYGKLIDPRVRLAHHDVRMKLAKQSMSVVVIHFGFRNDGKKLDLQHHNIILGPRYEGLLTDIFDRKIEFDLAVLERRCQDLGIPFALGRVGGRARILAGDRGLVSVARVPGRVVLDGIAPLKNATWSFDRYTREHVGRARLGRGKE